MVTHYVATSYISWYHGGGHGGALSAGRKKWIGLASCWCHATAIGGGTVRDILRVITRLVVKHPEYLAIIPAGVLNRYREMGNQTERRVHSP